MTTNTHWAQAESISYSTPRPGDYTPSVVEWLPSAERAVLLVHDMQRYFLGRFDRTAEPATNIVENIARAIDVARQVGVPIVYTAQPGNMTPEQRGLLGDLWGPGMTVAAHDRAVVDELAPAPEDTVFDKWRYSAFVRSPLAEHIEKSGRDQLIICGIYAHVGVLATALDAYSRDLETFVLADAVGDFDRPRHIGALNHMARTSARVCPTAAVVNELRSVHDNR